jgi:cell fate regulator YaaT (PSP1 superfamily)
MIPVVGVRFKKTGRIYYFDPDGKEISAGMFVIVETSRGIEYGEVVIPCKLVPEEEVVQPLKKVLRIATDEDAKKVEELDNKQQEALRIACEQVAKLNLDMKMVDTEYTFDEQKIVFYFVSDNRVDFRELVKQLAAIFKIRVELRQIGVRDHGKMMGGYGICGRSLCCASWLSQFEPISIRHAKDQELALNPGRISGLCGRLKCCLRHEAEVYREIRQRMPKVGTVVSSPYGEGKVVESHVINEKVTLQIEEKDEIKKVLVDIKELCGYCTGCGVEPVDEGYEEPIDEEEEYIPASLEEMAYEGEDLSSLAEEPVVQDVVQDNKEKEKKEKPRRYHKPHQRKPYQKAHSNQPKK